MKTKPLLFSGPMVLKLLAGEKFQTRRIAQNMYDKAFMAGDVLWVRETWGIAKGHSNKIVYAVDRPEGVPRSRWFERPKPSIHMPKSVSRLTLPVTALRIECLQDISEADARAEGVGSVAEYRDLWDQLNSSRKPWRMNPLVFVVNFEILKINVNDYLKTKVAA